MMNYKSLSNQPAALLALTGLTRAEFRDLLPAFEAAYDRVHPADQTATGQPRQRWPGAGRRSALPASADKLLFVLVYLKAYPLQVVLGKLFGRSTSQANHWLHRLLPVLRAALDSLGVLPERDGGQLAKQPAGSGRLIIDGTERRRQRPKNPEKQAAHYSGKKKAHTDKNVLVASASSRRVLFLGETRAGAVNDKRVADEEGLTYPPDTTLYKDAGFQGYEPAVRETRQAKKKKPRGGALTEREKGVNRKLSRVRVRVAHAIAGVKRSRIVKDVFRNKKPGLSDASMEIATGLHNLRVNHRGHNSKG